MSYSKGDFELLRDRLESVIQEHSLSSAIRKRDSGGGAEEFSALNGSTYSFGHACQAPVDQLGTWWGGRGDLDSFFLRLGPAVPAIRVSVDAGARHAFCMLPGKETVLPSKGDAALMAELVLHTVQMEAASAPRRSTLIELVFRSQLSEDREWTEARAMELTLGMCAAFEPEGAPRGPGDVTEYHADKGIQSFRLYYFVGFLYYVLRSEEKQGACDLDSVRKPDPKRPAGENDFIGGGVLAGKARKGQNKKRQQPQLTQQQMEEKGLKQERRKQQKRRKQEKRDYMQQQLQLELDRRRIEQETKRSAARRAPEEMQEVTVGKSGSKAESEGCLMLLLVGSAALFAHQWL